MPFLTDLLESIWNAVVSVFEYLVGGSISTSSPVEIVLMLLISIVEAVWLGTIIVFRFALSLIGYRHFQMPDRPIIWRPKDDQKKKSPEQRTRAFTNYALTIFIILCIAILSRQYFQQS